MQPPPPIPTTTSYNSRRKSSKISVTSSGEGQTKSPTLYIPKSPLLPQSSLERQSTITENVVSESKLQFEDGFIAESMDEGLNNGYASHSVQNGNGAVYDSINTVSMNGHDPSVYQRVPNMFGHESSINHQSHVQFNADGEQFEGYAESAPAVPFNQAAFTETPYATQTKVSYTWKLSKNELLANEKLVSIPFGPSEWTWQIVLYPFGAGDARNQYMSAFLRVVKNNTEAAESAWERPINGFNLRIKRGTVSTPVSVNSGFSEDEDHIIQYSEPDFKAFSENQLGWGFHEFCPLPFPDDILSGTDLIRIEAQITGPIIGITRNLEHEEQLSFSLISNHQLVNSSLFGGSLEDSWWQAQFSPVTDEMGNLTYLSAYLRFVHSDYASQDMSWRRKIATFTMKLLHPISREVLSSKVLTGGFTFSEENPFSGWEEFINAESFLRLGLEFAILQIQISWDPQTFIPEKSTAPSVSQTQKDLEWYKVQFEQSQLTLKSSESVLKKHDLALGEIQELRKRVQMLTSELNNSRASEKEYRVSQVRLSTVKEKLSKLRVSLESDFPHHKSEGDDDYSTELASCKLQLANVFYEKAQVDLKLSQALSELQFINRSSKDNMLLAPIPPFEDQDVSFEMDPVSKITMAIETARNEATVGRAALDEFKSKTANRNLPSLSNLDRAGLIADISMVQCGLDVANATLTEAAEDLHLLTDVTEFLIVQKELQDVRMLFSRTRAYLDENNSRTMLSHASSMDSQGITSPNNGGIVSPLFPPPVVPSLIPKNRGKRSSNPQFSEVEQQSDLKAISVRIETLADMLKTGAVGSTVAASPRSFRPADIEPWTPKEGTSSLDHAQLQILLRDLNRKSGISLISLIFPVFSILAIVFGIYSTVFIICGSHKNSPPFSDFGPVCQDVVLPIWEQTHLAWHTSSEHVVVELLPKYAKLLSTGAINVQKMAKDSIRNTLDKAMKQGSDVHLARQKYDPIHPADPDAPKTTPSFTNEAIVASTSIIDGTSKHFKNQPMEGNEALPVSRYTSVTDLNSEPISVVSSPVSISQSISSISVSSTLISSSHTILTDSKSSTPSPFPTAVASASDSLPSSSKTTIVVPASAPSETAMDIEIPVSSSSHSPSSPSPASVSINVSSESFKSSASSVVDISNSASSLTTQLTSIDLNPSPSKEATSETTSSIATSLSSSSTTSSMTDSAELSSTTLRSITQTTVAVAIETSETSSISFSSSASTSDSIVYTEPNDVPESIVGSSTGYDTTSVTLENASSTVTETASLSPSEASVSIEPEVAESREGRFGWRSKLSPKILVGSRRDTLKTPSGTRETSRDDQEDVSTYTEELAVPSLSIVHEASAAPIFEDVEPAMEKEDIESPSSSGEHSSTVLDPAGSASNSASSVTTITVDNDSVIVEVAIGRDDQSSAIHTTEAEKEMPSLTISAPSPETDHVSPAITLQDSDEL